MKCMRCFVAQQALRQIPELLPEREMNADLTRRDLRRSRTKMIYNNYTQILPVCLKSCPQPPHSQSAGHKRELSSAA